MGKELEEGGSIAAGGAFSLDMIAYGGRHGT
jgi:hypothetical protein